MGWNVTYAFNESDFKISLQLIVLYLNKAIENNQENLPWQNFEILNWRS
ncbi:MAG: hypothetical protein IPK55_12770, partial [Streptococcus sp.]|nr:hypothetical protein [Streptococcus sp.]